MTDDDTLTVAGVTLHADDTDEQKAEALSYLSFVYSPLLGLEGGDLGRLHRDIQDGHLTLPGCSRRQSLEVVMGALDSARDRHARWLAEDRKLWWRRHGTVLALITLMAVLLITVSVFSEEIVAFPSSGGAPPGGTEDWVVTAFEFMTGLVLPTVGVFSLMAVAVIIAVAMTRRRSTR